MYKKTVLIDLDVVLNNYNGNFNETYFPPMKTGADKFLENLSKNYAIVIFTARNLLCTSKWLIDNKLDKYVRNVTNVKEPSYLIIDDRAINFNGNYSDLTNEIRDFKVWYKNN